MTVRTILVATDFSSRSDRALRRATLLAKGSGASLSLVHVIDDDQPGQIVQAERGAAAIVLDEQARSLREIDGVHCKHSIRQGVVFEEIAAAAEEIDVDLLVIGPHRRHALKDVFVGTTAERAIRASRRPVLMANGIPAGPYRHVLIAVDLSESSGDAVRAAIDLGLEQQAVVSVLHVFGAPGTGHLARSIRRDERLEAYLTEEKEQAARELDAFLRDLSFDPMQRILKAGEPLAATAISAAVQEIAADLIVIGTRGRTGLAKLVLGSVAQEVLRVADRDVLVVPPRRRG